MRLSKEYLIIIPARSGSKRLPGKNKMNLNGLPLIDWTVNAAIQSRVTKEIYISTDDKYISHLYSNSNSINVLKRPQHLADDETSTADVILDILKSNKCIEDRHIILLQPTSPLRNAEHIRSAVSIYDQKNYNSMFSVTNSEHPPEWTITINDNIAAPLLSEEFFLKRSQDLPITYRLNGAIFIVRESYFREQKKFVSFENSIPFIMEPECSVDIDNMLDFKLAECILNTYNANHS